MSSKHLTLPQLNEMSAENVLKRLKATFEEAEKICKLILMLLENGFYVGNILIVAQQSTTNTKQAWALHLA